MKQAALARAIKVPPQTLSGYELGPNKIPATVMPKIADALGVTICELYGINEGHRKRTAGRNVSDEVVARLEGALTDAQRDFLSEMATGLARLRERLRAEEGLASGSEKRRDP